MNDRQLRWAGSLAALMQAAVAARQAAAQAEAARAEAAAPAVAAAEVSTLSEATAAASGLPATPMPQSAAGGAASPGAVASAMVAATPASVSRPQAKALGVFGRVWDFLIDEASYVEAAEGVPRALLDGVKEWLGSLQPSDPHGRTLSGACIYAKSGLKGPDAS